MRDGEDPIAGKDEVLAALTEVLRSGAEEKTRPADRCRAAALLGRYYGLFTPKDEAAPAADPAAVRRLEEAVRALRPRASPEAD